MELSGRNALVTGATRGIGEALARALTGEGVRLVLAARGGEALAETAAELDAEGVTADLTRPEDVDRLVRRTRDAFGGAPDVLVNNAGIFHLEPASSLAPELFDRHLALNLSAPFRLVRAFLPEMLARGSGRLVHLGSQAGRIALPGNAAYSASKYGLRGLHEVLEVELEETGVDSLLVEPGPVDTSAWNPLEDRLGDDLPARDEMLAPEAVADRVVGALVAGRSGALPLTPEER